VLPWVSAFDTAPVWQAAALLPPIAHAQAEPGAGRAQDGAALAG
jgi:hypothetical protein